MGIDVQALPYGSDQPEGGHREARNAEVATLFDEIADILEIKGDQPYRVNAYRSAARSIGHLEQPLEVLFAENRLREIRGVGEALEAKIVEYLTTGRLEYHERITGDFPAGLASLLGVPGLGPSRARLLYDQLHVASVADLERAAREGRLLGVPGFGEKAVHNLLQALERMKERTTRNLLSTGWEIGESVAEALRASGAAGQVAVAGSVRRMLETAGNVDLVAAAADPAPLLDVLIGRPSVLEVVERAERHAAVVVYGGVLVRLWVVPPDAWGSGLIWYTGARAHVERLEALARQQGWRLTARGLEEERTGRRLAGADEAEVHERLGLAWIPPELREDAGEIEAAQARTLPRLIELGDLKGDLHCHTSWTDGVHSLEEMATAARARGYQYMAVTDHSQSLTVARGLTAERLAEQRRLMDRLNRKLAPFTILLGTEMDILRDGRLDYPDAVLATLDYVSASVHSAFNQTREAMTARIVRAVSSPSVHTLNHPRGRIIRRREAYEVDLAAVVEAAARSGCALELNSQPDRLDLDGAWARRARAAGARLTVSSDAHTTRDLALIRYGIGSARRGWLEAADVVNTRPLEELRAWLARPGGQGSVASGQ